MSIFHITYGRGVIKLILLESSLCAIMRSVALDLQFSLVFALDGIYEQNCSLVTSYHFHHQHCCYPLTYLPWDFSLQCYYQYI